MSTKLRITPSVKNLLVYGLLAAVILIPRIIGLDEFVTVDEPVWTSHSANFYYALGESDFENTFQEYHPGVTTMWA